MVYPADIDTSAQQGVGRRHLRVLYYISYPQRMAGANRSLFELVTNLPAAVTPVIMLAGEGEVASRYRAAGYEVHVIPPGPALNQFGKAMLRWSYLRQLDVGLREHLPYTLKLWQFLRRLNVDLVHVNDPRGALLIGLAARLARRPVVGHLRGEKPFGGAAWWIFETLPHRIISVSSAMEGSLSPRARRKNVVVYNGIRAGGQGEARIGWLEALRAKGTTVVCCFASVVPFKGHHHLLEAVAELNRCGAAANSVFVCVGDLVAEHSEYHDWLGTRQRELQIRNLTFTGWQPDPFAFYRAADIVVLPSVSREQLQLGERTIEVRGNEGLPRTHLEAMCFGLPIVGTAIAGVREQIEDGVNGFVVPPADPAALAMALERLLIDPALRASMGAAGLARVQRLFSTAAYVDGVLGVYEALLARGAARSSIRERRD
jgi:glycosyltransferase involved in cell wall biosynthesis